MTRLVRPGLALTLAGAIVGLGALTSPTSGRAADDQLCSPSVVPTSEALADATAKVNDAHLRMHVDRAQELATGRGIKVAVIDSGIAEGLPSTPLYRFPGTSGALMSGHGTIVAGLIAGEDGVAPEASVYDVRVFDKDEADETQGERPLTSAGLVAGIRAVIDAMPREGFDVVNISLAVRSDDVALRQAVADLVAQDVVVVASAGNADDSSVESDGTPGNDASVFPADYPGVVAVSAATPPEADPSEYLLPNLDTDVAAPTVGAFSVNATGRRCVIDDVATSWATAEVSGLVALLRQRFPGDTPPQTVARLQATTEGSGAVLGDERARNPWSGAGVVQAHDALTRQLQIRPDGTVEGSVRETGADAQAPPAPAKIDLFGTPRALLLWFGLLTGAVMAAAFMLRPLLRR